MTPSNVQHERVLYPHEELLLLALHDEKGTAASNTAYTHAIGGAVIAELLLLKRISLSEQRKSILVDLGNATPTGEPLLDACLERIANAKRRRSVGAWVTDFAGMKRLRHRIAEGLCNRGVLKAREGKVLLVFSRTTYPTADTAPERDLLERLRRAVEGEIPDPQTLIVLSLAMRTGLLHLALGSKTVKQNRKWIEQLIEGDFVGSPTKHAAQAAQAAAMVATMTATTVAVTST